MSRPRPVLIYMAVMAGLGAVLGFAGLGDLLPARVIAWLALATAVVAAVGGVLVQGVVTPLSDPRDAEGRRLLPAPPSGSPLRR